MPKLLYLSGPYMAEKLTDRQNITFANLGITDIINLKDQNGSRDTVAISRFNALGFLIRKDSFYLFEGRDKYIDQLTYQYHSENKSIKEDKTTSRVYNSEAEIYKMETIFNYDNRDFLVKKEIHLEDDTIIWNFVVDENGVITSTTIIRPHIRDTLFSITTYKVDMIGRMLVVACMERKRLRKVKSPKLDKNFYKAASYDTTYYSIHFSYNNKLKTVRYFYNNECLKTFHLERNRQVLRDYCCPISKTRSHSSFGDKTTITEFDSLGRILKSGSFQSDISDMCETNYSDIKFQTLKYNDVGLIDNIDVGWATIFFHYK